MPGLRGELEALLEAVRAGAVEPAAALERLAELPYRDLGFARVDLHRELRQGAPEAVLAEGKTPEQVAAIVRALVDGGAGSVLVTRADEVVRAAVREACPDAEEDARARAVWISAQRAGAARPCRDRLGGHVGRAGAHEARIRAELLGADVVGARGRGRCRHPPARGRPSGSRDGRLRVVVAGMDGALASVVGGLVAAPVIGVPTSVGYGSARAGETALNAMLCSCAAGLAVVGIDDGFGAGTIAARIARAAGGEGA